MSKLSGLFDSFTWNVAMSLLSLVMLANYLVSVIATGSFGLSGFLLIVWIVIAFHFISVACKQYREKLRQDKSGD
jgi:hypothetical protein